MDKTNAIKRGIEYLKVAQEPDGSFPGYSSARLKPFRLDQMYHTVFVPALILGALHDVPNTASLRGKVCRWLLAQRSDEWSFNYWAKDSPQQRTLPYPDDLDDTFCTLIALWHHNPALIEGSALAKIVKLLVITETAVGGPYRTWLVPSDSPDVWLDVDLAVNSNIAYFLRLVADPLPSLTALMEQAITLESFSSPYYPTVYPVIYYLSRAYSGDRKDELAAYLKRLAKQGHWGSPLHTALALSSLKAMGKPAPTAAEAYLLRTQQVDGSWPAEAYCIDPARQGKTYYHGSSALTTALVVEALQPNRALSSKRRTPRHEAQTDQLYSTILSTAQQELAGLAPPLSARGLAMLSGMQKADNIHEILLLPYLFASTLKGSSTSLTCELYSHLGLANLYGWIAYTIYDDFLDDEGTPGQLPVATTSLRYSLAHFKHALPTHTSYQAFVQHTFNIIDGANAWEVAYCRFMATGGRIEIDPLPDYSTLDRLAERSLGHILTPVGVLAACGLPPDSPASQKIQSALKYYIIARQLNDDAHDWRQDMLAGHISYVVACILGDLRVTKGKRNLRSLMPAMQREFWRHTVATICGRITEHTALARTSAQESGMLAPTNIITGLCDRLDESVARTLAEQTKAKDFLAAYHNPRTS